jgi:DNA-binding MarR family transcriptional regulator
LATSARDIDRREQLFAETFAAERAYQRAVDDFEEALVHHLGINRSDARCLDVLEERGPMPAGELAAATGLSPAATTSLVDRLEHAGYLSRVRDESDRRRVLISLTDAGRQNTRACYAPLLDGEAWVRALTVEQLQVVRDFLRLGAARNEAQAAHVRALPSREGRRGTRSTTS